MHGDFFFQLISNSLKMSNFVKNEIYSNDKDLVYMFMYTYLTSIWPCFYILVYILSGADVDASGAKGRTILFIAVLESSLNCMELLLKNGCKTNVRDNHGFTILKTIFKTNSIIKAEAIKLLQKFGQLKLLWYMHVVFTFLKSHAA